MSSLTQLFFLGASLAVNSTWKNPSGEWRVGSKFVYELFTNVLTSRLKVKIIVTICVLALFIAFSTYSDLLPV